MDKVLYVYILQCADESYYTGVTNDYYRRLSEHQHGINPDCYTFNRRPVKLVYVEAFEDFNLAISREKQIKGWTRAKKEALVKKERKKLKELAECKNETNSKNYKL
jgi:putative endonuclease